ncbi:hypothetical protein LF1_41450 [Rubripirellula obstinata]|uniref:Uncharacterized protein n=1 Tax=Rubripirellula obstinata TaxID=406547 RepID=A0A5B1CNS0_9BACT|nr:hypothetical protein LF1_41450 [Rubripirellula obstinata]
MNSDATNELSSVERTEQLTWELLDGQLSESALSDLEGLMRNDPECLRCYISCVQLEQDLKQLFHGEDAKGQSKSNMRLPGFPPINLASDGNSAITN